MTHRSARAVLACTVVAVALVLAGPAPAAAQGLLSSVEIHGFGGWAYGETDGLRYSLGDADGRYDNAQFALNVSAEPTDRLSLVAQVFLESSGEGDGEEAELDYAFAEWFFSDALKLRVGRVKHPFGLYGEIFDVGTLRPFYLLPQSVYGPLGFTAKAYNGVGVTGSTNWDSGWELQYDAYVGEIEGDFELPGLLTVAGPLLLEPQVEIGFAVQDTIGARLALGTPVDGLSFGLSGYVGDEVIRLASLPPASRETYLAHGEYASDRWTVRGEWGALENRNGSETIFDQTSSYLEVAYKVTDSWELAARGEDVDIELPGTELSELPPFFPQILGHEDLAFGVSYWFTPGFVVRLNVHQVKENRLAFVETPEEVLEVLTTGQLEDETELVVVGAQFSF